ncbi:hypothetical protein CR201_G0022460 [Pongo abelii]|uniref:Uncharacterized protein n=1 Tax=Pongo abelii TaxID=9601 RepID=A0A2J8V590_PONAB|nr:hypothetical protein CR201_G0022460 [Pongo abelii]
MRVRGFILEVSETKNPPIPDTFWRPRRDFHLSPSGETIAERRDYRLSPSGEKIAYRQANRGHQATDGLTNGTPNEFN